jgi:CDP-diacylglycerol--glycerol-3-phosphate 3-phosphatidyltransferase
MKKYVKNAIHDDGIWTWANAVTLVRLCVSLTLLTLSATLKDESYNYAGLAVFWAGDLLDGFLARKLDQETLLGAQFDILADRTLFFFFYMNYMNFHPETKVVVILFLINFMVIDHYLSNQFMRWPVISPNYFYQVDRRIWQLNWSPIGKFLNSGLITGMLVLIPTHPFCLITVVSLIALKLYSGVRLFRIATLSQARKVQAAFQS